MRGRRRIRPIKQQLAPRQRAILILRDVLGWSARDVAELLDVSVQAANSTLQRARARTDRFVVPASARPTQTTERDLVDRYLRAWEQADVDGLVALLTRDATLSMPPLTEWYSGIDGLDLHDSVNRSCDTDRSLAASHPGRSQWVMCG